MIFDFTKQFGKNKKNGGNISNFDEINLEKASKNLDILMPALKKCKDRRSKCGNTKR